jgi:hypothetical protein
MNNAFDPAQLGGNMRGIVGSKLFGKSLPKKDTVSQFVYGTSSLRGKKYPICPRVSAPDENGKCYCVVQTNETTINAGIAGTLAEGVCEEKPSIPRGETTGVLMPAGKKAGAVIGGCRFPVSAGSNPPFGTMGVQVANGKPCQRQADGIHLAV